MPLRTQFTGFSCLTGVVFVAVTSSSFGGWLLRSKVCDLFLKITRRWSRQGGRSFRAPIS
jgi:hypothetical protein